MAKKTTKKKPAAKTAKKKSSTKKKPAAPKNSLVANINRRKQAGISRAKQDSTISPAAYKDMQAGWPNSKKNKKKVAKKRS